jgi:hypothetical protein
LGEDLSWERDQDDAQPEDNIQPRRAGAPGADRSRLSLPQRAARSRLPCSNACSNPGGIRRHMAAPGGLKPRTS